MTSAPTKPPAVNILQQPLAIEGVGVVSPAGSGIDALYQASQGACPAYVSRLEGKSYTVPSSVLADLPRNPRLRRASPITRYVVAAAQDAMSQLPQGMVSPERIGLVCSFFNGCVRYTKQFYHEVLHEPGFASPLIFPETVYNAPASHLATILGLEGPVNSLIGDESTLAEALAMAGVWLQTGMADACLVITAEEADEIVMQALEHYHEELQASEGAAAFLLTNKRGDASPQVTTLVGSYPYQKHAQRKRQLSLMAQTLQTLHPKCAYLVDGRTGIPAIDKEEEEAWAGYAGERLSPRKHLGYAIGTAPGYELALAAYIARTRASSCMLSIGGARGAAYGALLQAGQPAS